MIKTTDMYLAGALLAYGGAYRGVDKSDVKRQRFIFDDELDIATIYISNGTEIQNVSYPTYDEFCNYADSFKLLYPPNYPQALKKMKTIIHK